MIKEIKLINKCVCFLLLLIITINNCAFSQKKNYEEWEKLSKSNLVLTSNQVKPEYFYYYNLFQKLKVNSSSEDLIFLCNDDNKIIKSYAYIALLQSDSIENDILYRIIKNSLYDNSLISVAFEGPIYEYFIGDFFYINYINSKYKNKTIIEKLDSLIFYDNNIYLEEKHYIIEKITPECNCYTKLQEFINTKKFRSEAIVAMARFQKEPDTVLIRELLNNKNTFYYGLKAIREFPHPSFYKEIKIIYKKEINNKAINSSTLRYIYQILVRYETEDCKNTIISGLEKKKGFAKSVHNKYLYLALEKYPSKFYLDIKVKICLSKLEVDEIIKEYDL